MGGRLGRVAKSLLAAGYCSADVRAFPQWWARNDWRGKKGQLPKPEQVLELITQARSGTTTSPPRRPNLRYEGNEVVVVEDDPWIED
jgi:hypothetical protein